MLEVASRTTGFVDYTAKRVDYARYGVGEYWRFDPTRGEYHDDALAGDRLVGGRYEPIAIVWTDAEHGSGYSEALGAVCVLGAGGSAVLRPGAKAVSADDG